MEMQKQKIRIAKMETQKLETMAMAVSKSVLKKTGDSRAKKRQLRYAKKIINDELLFSI